MIFLKAFAFGGLGTASPGIGRTTATVTATTASTGFSLGAKLGTTTTPSVSLPSVSTTGL